jgi:hypothetical protein
MVNVDAAEEVKVMMVVVEPEDGLGVEVEEYHVLRLILWIKHSILTFRWLPTVC